jgi:steroid delta-isomerase-like uncharacterized protein
MSEENKELVRRFFDAVASGDESRLDDIVAIDAVDHTPFPNQAAGREGVKQIFRSLRSAFPDFQQEILELISEGDRVAVRSMLRGTHQGEFMGVPATGRPVEIESIDILTVRGGRFVEHWGLFDQMALMSQLGAMPPA